MKLLVYGGNGWICKQFLDYLKNHNTINLELLVLSNNRVDNIDLIKLEIEEIKPTHILCMIGRTNGPGYTTIDYLEQTGKLVDNIRDNLFSPVCLAILCQKYNIHLTYLGTGCIFEYKNKSNLQQDILPDDYQFTEDDLPNFFGSSYSIVKGYTDRFMKLFEDNTLNLRIRMPISYDNNPRNFITKITTYSKICSIYNSMTVLSTMFPIIIDLMINNKTGTFNLTNPGVISHNEILTMYRDIIDNNFKWSNFDINEQSKILSAGRSNNYLSYGYT
jgi:dTDP-4-dehydrorhamnose reductase